MLNRSEAAGKPFFLVGSDYVFPRTSNSITKAQLEAIGGEYVGEEYLDLQVTKLVQSLQNSKGIT